MQHINIRKAGLQDLETLLEFEQGIIMAERPFDPTLKEGHINYYDLNKMIFEDHVQLLVAEWNSGIIASGYARIEESKPFLHHSRHAYLGFMYVHPHHRGKGINGMIIKELQHWALSKDITELRLEVYFDNEAAIRAYEKWGFKKHMIEMRKC